MMRVRLDLQYKGTKFGGWQKQKAPGLPTIQGILEATLSKIHNQPVRVIGSGRTDAGTHARHQVAHCDLPRVQKNLVYALNQMLPEGISVTAARPVGPEFHALGAAKEKTYIYRIWNRNQPNPFISETSLWHPYPLDVQKLNSYAQVFLGTHDFKSLQTRGTPVPDTTRTLFQSEWAWKRPHLLEYRVSGNGFLKQMVRNLVGLQLYALRKNWDSEALKTVLAAKDRSAAKDTAPAHGLILWKVHYPA